MKKIPIILVFAFVLLFGVALLYGYYYSQNNAVQGQLLSADKEILQLRTEVDELAAQETVSAQRATNALKTIESSEIIWSELLATLDKVIPLDLVEKKPLVSITSYNGSENGKLTFNVHTNASTNVKKQMRAVADTIKAFNDHPEFDNGYVPSISKSVTEDEETVLSFVLHVDYDPIVSISSLEDFSDDSTVKRK